MNLGVFWATTLLAGLLIDTAIVKILLELLEMIRD